MKKALVLLIFFKSLLILAQQEWRTFKRKDIFKANALFYDPSGMFRFEMKCDDSNGGKSLHHDILYIFNRVNNKNIEIYELPKNGLVLTRFKNDTVSRRHYFKDSWFVSDIFKLSLNKMLNLNKVPPGFSNLTFFPFTSTIYDWKIPFTFTAKKEGEWYTYTMDKSYWRFKLFLDSSGVVKQYQEMGLVGAEAGEGISWNFTFQKIYNISLEKFADSVYEINNKLLEYEKVKKERIKKDSAIKVITHPLKPGMQLPVFNCAENRMLQLDSFDFVLAESWYIQCQPCYMMKKDLEANKKEFTNRKIKVLGYNTINDTTRIRRFLYNKGYDGHEINTNVFRSELLNTSSYPTIYLLNRDLKVVQTFVGYDKNKVREILDYIDKMRHDKQN
jgi:hypothetical protein